MSGWEPTKVNGGTRLCAGSASFGFSVRVAGSSATFVPAESVIVHGALDAIVAFFACASRTRTVESGAGPKVVPE